MMKRTTLFTAALILTSLQSLRAQELVKVEPFEKVTVSPHVQVTFTKGDQETVTIQNSTVDRSKVHIESKGRVLRVYLEGAKEITGNEKKEKGQKTKKSLYTGTVLTLVITYKTLEDLSVRGEETISLKSKLEQDSFGLTVYGASTIYFDELKLKEMRTTIYGESSLELKSGEITEQKFTAYGASEINAVQINNKITRATLYGEARLKLNVSDQLKVTSFGEAKVAYKGDPQISKGISVGKVAITKID